MGKRTEEEKPRMPLRLLEHKFDVLKESGHFVGEENPGEINVSTYYGGVRTLHPNGVYVDDQE